MHVFRIYLRRLTALLLSAVLSFAVAEQVIADEHDGDARATVSDASTRGHLPSMASPARHIAPSDAPHEHGELPGDSTPPAGHRMHVCHDGHAHGLWVRASSSEKPAAAVSGRLAGDVSRELASAVRETPLRPPIAG